MADPKRLSPADRRARDRLIRAEHEEGATLEALAQRFGVSTATVKRAIGRARTLSAEEQLAKVDPSNDLLAILDAQRDALATCVTEMREGDNSACRIGAAKAVGPIGQSLRDIARRRRSLARPHREPALVGRGASPGDGVPSGRGRDGARGQGARHRPGARSRARGGALVTVATADDLRACRELGSGR